jgi:hypothetical protein
MCKSCTLISHAANQVLNVRGGDHCDCPECDLAGLDDEREMEELMEGVYPVRRYVNVDPASIGGDEIV